MIKTILTTLLISTSALADCPNLDGTFKYLGKTTIEFSRSVDASDITTYKATLDDGTCAACHTDLFFKADGLVKQKSYDRANEVTKIYCENDRLKFRQTIDYLDDNGLVIFEEKMQQDYRINWENNLAIENIENEVPVSKVICPRIF